MKRMIYQVAVGEQSKLYEYCIQSVANYCLMQSFATL